MSSACFPWWSISVICCTVEGDHDADSDALLCMCPLDETLDSVELPMATVCKAVVCEWVPSNEAWWSCAETDIMKCEEMACETIEMDPPMDSELKVVEPCLWTYKKRCLGS